MKANRGQAERALDKPNPELRFYLFYGPDEAGSAALAERMARAMGPDAERIDHDGAALAKDPALLADDAASLSLFGGARWIRLRLAGDEAHDAIAALLEAERAGNPVVAVAGALKASSKIVKLALASPHAIACVSYVPEGEDAERLAMAIGREAGLRVMPDGARRLIDATGGDRAVLAREIEKLAVYLDAAPERPTELDHAALDAVGADTGEIDLSRLIDAVLGGAPDVAAGEIHRLALAGAIGVQTPRAFQRRLALLIELRACVDEGRTIDDAIAGAGKAIFWKDKAVIARQLRQWDGPLLARAQTRLLDTERQLKASQSAGAVVAAQELIAIGRQAARRRP